jgi:N-carbamoyl-L-amino-acid hydrolase
VNTDRLWESVEKLATFTRPDVPWTRRGFSPLFAEGREWLRREFETAGLIPSLDAAGNLIGSRRGKRSNAKSIITGSHSDTVVGGGRFDGMIGILAGIEVARTLAENGVELDHPLEVIDFLSEEPSDYGISCVGSRALSGVLDAAMLASTNAEGETLSAAIRRAGGDPEALTHPLRGPDSTAAFVELHIEQGPVLETRKIPIGIVTNIAGIRRALITVAGRPDHAGTTPMDLRRDALVGAARIIDQAYLRAAAASGNPHFVVATIGRIAMTPNVPNAVPGHVELMLEVRSDSGSVLDSFSEDLITAVENDLKAVRVSASIKHVSNSRPTACSPLVMDAVARAAVSLGYSAVQLSSGAGHDGVYVAATGPIGMIFVPCREGRSHCPEEWMEKDQLAAGARVLHQTILELDRTAA